MTDQINKQFRVEAGPEALTEEQRAANKWAEEVVSLRLQTLRGTAQHWQSTISTITALFGAATVLNADQAVRTLTSGWNYLYGLLVMLSLIFAGLALKLASQAGEPPHLTVPPDITERVKLHDQVFERASSQLAWSRLLAGPAVALLIFAICIRWYGPQISDASLDHARQHTQELADP